MGGKSKKYYILFISAVLVVVVSCGVPYGVYHTVEKGQTLYNIARIYNVQIGDIEKMNNITDTTELKPGQKIFIPGAEKVLYVPPTVETTHGQHGQNAVKKAGNKQLSSAGNIAKQRTGSSVAHNTAAMTFIWPLQGKLLQTFSTSNGSRHDGIDIKASEGTPVKAAASGSVIYSNDTIRGYGNMVIIKHRDGFVTVYAHNSINLVKKGQDIRQGQVIGKVGQTGYATTPHLHFEIRLRAIPQNPLDYLPAVNR